ncbi:unnamed protein product [Linum tenue]|nr:unnamed protein product [Linum tenue]
MRLYRSLPPRPSIDEVEAAVAVVKSIQNEEQAKLEEISKHQRPPDVPEELFALLQQVRRTVAVHQCREQSREAARLVELDEMFEMLGGLIQRASLLVSGDSQVEKSTGFDDPVAKIAKETGLVSEVNSNEKLSLLKVAAMIENSAKSGAETIDLRGKLMDQIEWLPTSIGKLSSTTELDLSENKIIALPPSISNLKSVTKLDLHSNQLMNLPDSFGELINLTDLDLHANNLKSLPTSIGNLKNMVNLDLSSNHFISLPDTIGDLTKLKTLIAETNELEELPYTIGNCSSLTELRLDFNNLKALPEAVGKLECLEVLTLHYNRVKSLPTTMGNLLNLKEIDVSFNELEYLPESLCFAVQLKKINVGKNFADLRALPRSIGNLEMLEELDISDDQIRVLPDSFRFLSKLRVFHANETPLEVPPREVCKLGAQAVVQYMADLVASRDAKLLAPEEKKGLWLRLCLFCFPFLSNTSK